MRTWRSEKGAALLEAAITIPILLMIAVGTLEFGRAYQTWQVITNAAREGARIAVLPGNTSTVVDTRVRDYMRAGQLPNANTADVRVDPTTITVNGVAVGASRVTVNYPFSFIALQPVVRLISPGTAVGAPLTMSAQALMRNETQ
jgi:Flp pilus assembly protein TadG